MDGRTIADVERGGVAGFLAELAADLRAGRHRPSPVRRVRIPKADGRQRASGIPAVRERVAQAAAKAVREPIFEADFRGRSDGCRPKRPAHQAPERVRQAVNRGYGRVVDADIQRFFDRIPHPVLMDPVGKRVRDRRLRKPVRSWLEAGVLADGAVGPSDAGVPQGGVLSPSLANAVLREPDRPWEDHDRHLGQPVRYADDSVLLCRTEAAAHEALRRVGAYLAGLGLTLHPEKTRGVFVGDGQAGFGFLGGHTRKAESWRYRGKRYCQRWPSRRAMQAVRSRIKESTAPRHRLPEPIAAIVTEVNQLLRGWGATSGWATRPRHLQPVDNCVRERLALFLRKKTGQRGRGWKSQDLAFFRRLGVHCLSGTVVRATAPPRAGR